MVASTEGTHRPGAGATEAGAGQPDSAELIKQLKQELRSVRAELRQAQANPEKELNQLRLKLAQAQRELTKAKQVKDAAGVAQAKALSAELTKLRVSLQNTSATVKRHTGIAYIEAVGAELKAIQKELGQIQGTLALSRLQLGLILLGVCWSAIAVADVVFYSRQLWYRLQDFPGLGRLLEADEASGDKAPDILPTTTTPLQTGDQVVGYRVTSGFGSRVPPCEGCSAYHPAIDLATPTGTTLFAPVSASVQCLGGSSDPAGNYAKLQPKHAEAPQFLLLHLEDCTPGDYAAGERIGTTGATGQGTGPHLDVRQIEEETYVNPTREWVERILSPATNILSDAEILCAIGAAEGTLNEDCSPNDAYYGHTDPGNGAHNLGAFSYQHGAVTPTEADQKQLAELRSHIPHYQAQARAKFGTELSKAALLTVLDLHNQAPAAAADFIQHLPSHDPTPQALIETRTKGFVNPVTGQLEAPGLGNSQSNVRADQKRRVDELLPQINSPP
ncbi:MAG: peptidoglycan DD-metalloendopeptidase family protein [Cyanobacteria bacterium J06607_6]